MTEEQETTTQEQEQGQEEQRVETTEEEHDVSGKSAEDVESQETNADVEKNNIEKAKENTPKWFQKKIDEMTWKIRERDRKLEMLERNYEALVEEDEEYYSEPGVGSKPNIDDFETTEEYAEALFDYKISQSNAQREKQLISERARETQIAMENQFEQKRKSVMKKGIEKYDGFYDAIAAMPASIMNETVAQTLVEASNAEDVAHFLATNMNEAQKIAEMSPVQVAIKIGEISTRLKNKPKVKESSASEPIKPVGGSAASTEKDPSEMTDKEYSAWYRKRKKNRKF
jgi:hypothetical protein